MPPDDVHLHLPARRDALSADRFNTPELSDRPGMRWWWQSPLPPAELVRELHAIADAGFGEVEIAFSPGFWADDAQRAALGAVLAEAELLGVGVAMTLGSEWPVRTPNTTKGTKHAAQELQYGVTRIAGGEAQTVPLPPAFDDTERGRPSRLLAVTAARVLTWGAAPTIVPSEQPFGPRTVIVPPEASTVLDSGSLVDLTAQVEDGSVAWSPREGEWALFAFWSRDSEQGATSFLDRAAAAAAMEYLDEHQIGPENLDLLRRAGTELFEDSLELNADSLFWSPGLLDRFRERHGYDPTPYLPVLFAQGMCRYWVPNEEPTPDFDLDNGIGARIRRDYYRLVTDLYISDHLLLVQEWSVGHGLRHKAQVAYGQNLEPVRSNREFVRAGGRAEAESLNSGDRAPVRRDHPNWRFALDWQRSIVGGAHQGGATRISTELGAQFGAAFALTLGDLRQMLDKEWAAGITKPFVHGFGTQGPDAPWPTQSRFADFVADTWNDTHYPEWQNWRPLTDYWARGTLVLETGTPRTDVAIYRDAFLTTAARGFGEEDFTAPAGLADTEALERSGYSVQYLDPIGLADADAIGADGTLFPDGPSYRALLVDERAIAPAAAEALADAAERGLRVVFVGEPPSGDSGFGGGDEGRSDLVREAVGRALFLPGVARVEEMSQAAAALRDLGVVPRASWQGPPLLTQWREAGNRRYVLVYNPEGQARSVELSLEGQGAVQELDLVSGVSSAFRFTSVWGRTLLTLDLPALGLRVLELDLTAGEIENLLADSVQGAELPLAAWQLRVETEEPEASRTIELEGQGPADWRSVEALSGLSGIGTYSALVARAGKGATGSVLELGDLAGSAVVRIGSRQFGPAYVSGSVVDLGDALAGEGESEIEIEVCTSLRNAVVASGRIQGPHGVAVPQGLIGPVRVRTYSTRGIE
ncbi:glycosyl hydrolase [Agromyces albus]|uniref:Glycoside hydrolase n=1 Tax=Agromyces albus TaxID=205332 RepID=A0A4Q2L425_9MICO|nr:glycosyl hydrolase [Agromyces albus]RXZ71203.1 hypothetical protein ESP51_08275 [Agromyces albus]